MDRRIQLCKVRLSNHELMIEKGRHQRLKINQRNCPFCPKNLLEDEFHFLFVCGTFSFLREVMFSQTKHYFPGFENFPNEQKLKILLSDENLVNHSGNYLQKALELRRFLLNKHKNTSWANLIGPGRVWGKQKFILPLWLYYLYIIVCRHLYLTVICWNKYWLIDFWLIS